MAINKVVVDNVVKLDLTEDTVTPETLAKGITAHNSVGELIVGTMSSGASISYGQIVVGTTWTEGDDYYVQHIASEGLESTDRVIIDILLSDDPDTAEEELANYDLIQKIKVLDGEFVIYAIDETSAQITLMTEVKKVE